MAQVAGFQAGGALHRVQTAVIDCELGSHEVRPAKACNADDSFDCQSECVVVASGERKITHSISHLVTD